MKRLAIRIESAALLLVALISLGCPTPRLIRQAQDSFNAAARIETERRAAASDPRGALLEDFGSATGYRQTLALLDDELAQNREKLRQDGLLGNALVLKALCHWRLADLEDSADQRRELGTALADIRNDPTLNLGTRDRVLVAALTGLRDHDRGLRATGFENEEGTGAETFFCSAYKDLDGSLAAVDPPPSHPIRSYVELAKLAALREWGFAAERFLAAGPHLEKKRALQPCFYATASQLESSAGEVRRQVADLGQSIGFAWPLPAEHARDPAADRQACGAMIAQTCP